jgi:hypothetical protein
MRTDTLTAIERRSAVLMSRAVAMLDTADDSSLPLADRDRAALVLVASTLRRVASTLQALRRYEREEDIEARSEDGRSSEEADRSC